MRAAFLFSGQLRGFPLCIKSLEDNLFFNFDQYDTFFYVPSEDGKNLLNNWTPTAVTIEKDQYHPEVEGFDNNISYSDWKISANGYELKGRMQHYYLQWYGVKRVYQLFQDYKSVNDIEYDVVFRLRNDFKFYSKFHYEPFDGIQIPAFKGHGGIYDRFAFGPEKYIQYYCSLYDAIKQGYYKEQVALGNSESKLAQHLIPSGINIRYVHMNYERINKDGTSQSHREIDPG